MSIELVTCAIFAQVENKRMYNSKNGAKLYKDPLMLRYHFGGAM